MHLPTRTVQKRAESESYAILLYKLRRLGIFRNVTENDYGIDFEVELVENNAIIGRYFKAQVKAAQSISTRGKNRIPKVSGIKQSTLTYWCRLSYHSHVIAYAVDLATETVYVSRPVFWSATQLLDGTDTTKSISFLPALQQVENPALDETAQAQIVAALSFAFAMSPRVPDQIYAITTALRHMPDYLSLRVDAFHYDPQTELERPEIFSSLLDVSSVLLFDRRQEDFSPMLSGQDLERRYSYPHWAIKSGVDDETIICSTAQTPVSALLPLLIEELRRFQGVILAGALYWLQHDRQFLKLVHDAPLPPHTDDATLDAWGYDYTTHANRSQDHFSVLVHRVTTELSQRKNAVETARSKRRKAEHQAS